MTPLGTLGTLKAKNINLKSAVDFAADELATPRERLGVETPNSKYHVRHHLNKQAG